MSGALRLGVLISGGGTTFLNLHEKIASGALAAEIACVISSRSKAAGLARARELGYAAYFIGRRRFADDEAYSAAIDARLDAHAVDLVVLAGFLRRYLPPPQRREHCVNIHPSLLPAFGGEGFYGMRVHEAAWGRSCKVSGCTVHLVTERYDEGPIIVQKTVALDSADTPEDIRRKVFALECQALPEAIGLFAEGRIRFENGRALVAPPKQGAGSSD